jgi:hypothetical protein
VAPGRSPPCGIVFKQFDIEPVHTAGGPDVERTFANLFDGGDSGQRQKEAKVIWKVANEQATVSLVPKSSASKSAPSVATINLALAFAVAGLALSAARADPRSHLC